MRRATVKHEPADGAGENLDGETFDGDDPFPEWDYQAIGWNDEAGAGSLHVIEIADGMVILARFLTWHQEMLVTLAKGASVETLIAARKWPWVSVTRFPLDRWREATWYEGPRKRPEQQQKVQLVYEDEGQNRTATTWLSQAELQEFTGWFVTRHPGLAESETERVRAFDLVRTKVIVALLVFATVLLCDVVGILIPKLLIPNGWRAWLALTGVLLVTGLMARGMLEIATRRCKHRLWLRGAGTG